MKAVGRIPKATMDDIRDTVIYSANEISITSISEEVYEDAEGPYVEIAIQFLGFKKVEGKGYLSDSWTWERF